MQMSNDVKQLKMHLLHIILNMYDLLTIIKFIHVVFG